LPHRTHSIDAAYCDRCHTLRGLRVCVLDTRVSCKKMGEPIEMPFWGLTQVGMC